jgi:uncharacterized membrane protein
MTAHSENSPTAAADAPEGMSKTLHRNIQSAAALREEETQNRGLPERMSVAITAFVGSFWGLGLHALLLSGWIVFNTGWIHGLKPFDPPPFVLLAVFASTESIFLSTFILIGQNRMQRFENRRAELDLQINLLTEHEMTHAVRMLDAIAGKLQIPREKEHEIEDSKLDVDPRQVADAIAKTGSS